MPPTRERLPKTPLLVVVAAVASMALSGDFTARPSFLRMHAIWNANDEMLMQVQVVPHQDVLTVGVEAWELEREPVGPDVNGTLSEFSIPTRPTRRGNRPVSHAVTAAKPKQTMYDFAWKAGLDYGEYELVAVLETRRGRVASTPTVILVR